jgi:glucose-6-phosphate isomerase
MYHPINTIKLKSWKKLQSHFDKLQAKGIDLRNWLEDENRANDLTFDIADLHIDLSKNLINSETLQIFDELAAEIELDQKKAALYNGEHINNTEDRPVLHSALRRPATDQLQVDGQDVVKDVHQVLEKVYAFSDSVRNGEFKGVTGKKFKTIVNIGIGGSDLGPAMVYEAMKHLSSKEFDGVFVSNVDPNDIGEKLSGLDPETTLFVIVSKTFTTLETVTNAKIAKNWVLDKLGDNGGETIKHHFIAVSTALDLVADFGIDPTNAFGFWNWVGGRYSVDSAVGTTLALIFGKDFFAEFLSGFRAVDEQFFGLTSSVIPAQAGISNAVTTPRNTITYLALLNIWYVDFFKAASHAVLPYNQYLSRFAAYLQQLTMESNGKAVKFDGTAVETKTGEIFWGEPGTNGQHAFYQLIHQGTQLIPVDFIAFANPIHNITDGENNSHELLLSNVFAQAAALAFGKTLDEVYADEPDIDSAVAPGKVFSGNRPSTMIMAPNLTAKVLGELIALYEHITYIQGIVWGINSFDQWGVQLGKKLATDILPSIAGPTIDENLDPSTKGLISYYKTNKK